jgi:hypothetical protein
MPNETQTAAQGCAMDISKGVEPGDIICIGRGTAYEADNFGKLLRVTGGTRDLIEATPIDKDNIVTVPSIDGFGYCYVSPGEITCIKREHFAVVS